MRQARSQICLHIHSFGRMEGSESPLHLGIPLSLSVLPCPVRLAPCQLQPIYWYLMTEHLHQPLPTKSRSQRALNVFSLLPGTRFAMTGSLCHQFDTVSLISAPSTPSSNHQESTNTVLSSQPMGITSTGFASAAMYVATTILHYFPVRALPV